MTNFDIKGKIAGHEDKIGAAVDKAADAVGDKTGHAEQADKGADAVKRALGADEQPGGEDADQL